MFVLIAYSMGTRSAETIAATAVLVAITMPFGYWVETVARPLSMEVWSAPLSARLTPWALGHIPQVTAWGIVIGQLYNSDLTGVPWFVYCILWIELLFFFSFGLASLWSQLVTPRNWYKGEIGFQVLSLLSKGVLGLLLLSNVLMLSQFDDVYN